MQSVKSVLFTDTYCSLY